MLLAAIWGSSFLFMRIAVVDFGVLPTAAMRVAIAAGFLLPVMWLRGHGPALRQHIGPVLLIGLINSALPFICFAYALLTLSTGLTSILNATTPLFGAVVAWLWLRERLTALRVLGLLIGFAGVALLAWDKVGLQAGASATSTLLALAAGLSAGLSYGLAGSYTKRYLGGVPPLVTAAGSQLGATLWLALPAVWLWPAQAPGTAAWLALLALGLLCTGVAYVLFFRLIDQAGPARAMTVTFLIPVFAMGYGALLLDERFAPSTLGYAAVVLLGTLLATGLIGHRTR